MTHVINWVAVAIYLASVGYVLISNTSTAHEWYDALCCNDNDCAPVTELYVTKGAHGGYNIRIPAGAHPNAQREVSGHVRVLRDSQDRNWHVCVLHFSKYIQCVYAPKREPMT